MDYTALNAYLASRDYVVAAINYRSAPRRAFSGAARRRICGDCVSEDARDGARRGSGRGWFCLAAAKAGSWRCWRRTPSGEPSIRGVISLYGQTDLRFAYEHPSASWAADTRGTLETFMGGSPTRVEQAYFDASPINFVSAGSPPTLLIHGLRDELVPADQSARLDDRLQKAGVKHLFVSLPWATHACDRSFADHAVNSRPTRSSAFSTP